MLIQLNQNLENVKIYIYWLTDNRDNYEYKSFQKIVNILRIYRYPRYMAFGYIFSFNLKIRKLL